MQVVRMVSLQCSHVGGTQDITSIINMNGTAWLMKGIIVSNA